MENTKKEKKEYTKDSLDDGVITTGFLEVLPDGFGFIRNANYLSDPHDVYVSQSQIYKFKLKTGDFITGVVREPKASEKFRSLLHIQKINHYDLETAMKRKSFESLTPIFPNEKISVGKSGKIAMRMIDLLAPIGKGQRGIIVSPPKAGKTTLLKDIALAVKENNKDIHILILLIDESQDTKKELIDALLIVCEKYSGKFIVGMFGDTMQKIYMDGKEDLAKCIPDNWIKPVKIMNHRSAKRIVTLANSIRSTVDDKKQRARDDADEGIVRLFITSESKDKEYIEKKVAEMMAQDTGDVGWNDDDQYKSLILEHHMAASRFGFSELYMPLNDSKKFDTSLRDGSILELSILSKIVSPLVKAYKIGNDFEVAKIVRKNSPLLSKDAFVEEFKDQTELLKNAEEAVETLMQLWNDEKNLTCLEVLESIQNTGLFDVGSRIDELLTEYSQDEDEKITALRTALSVPFYEVERYALYVSDNTRFATHQGVKGLEFPRVMVILDDAQAKGFLFSYEKLFGVKAQSDTDIKNERDGKDTGITRTARLFYVACTRAENSLAVVAYTENEELVKATALSNGWFLENEIYII